MVYSEMMVWGGGGEMQPPPPGISSLSRSLDSLTGLRMEEHGPSGDVEV